ncbi:SpoIIE family protein phosphatase [Streptomyces sp. NPDC096538]|uniref:SpoIIE family protein phosphatase n=1 Tax=Streptomyces sp. NPDC096538 TaxID=3155427 RepID=UPI003331E467
MEVLERTLVQGMRDTGAHVGGLYLLATEERALRLAVLSGVPWDVALPWARVGLGYHSPVADALRERRLVWLGGPEEVARRYPQLAVVLPYPFMLAASAVTADDTVWGGLVLQWPGSRPPELSGAERDTIDALCRRLGGLLSAAAERDSPALPGGAPRLTPPPDVLTGAPLEPAVAFAERLPGGCCSLNADGRIVFVTATAARLLDAEPSELLGVRPWEALPWLNTPVAQDNYRAAVFSRRATSFTVLHPPGRWLSFRLYPDGTGISVRIASAAAPGVPDPGQSPAPEPVAAGRATGAYHLMHLAATLSEAVGVEDVVDRVAGLVLPATGAQALILMTTEEGRLRIIGHRGYAEDLLSHFDGVPLTAGTPAAQCLATGTPGFFPAFSDLRRAHPTAIRPDDMAAWCFLPLLASGHPVGTLLLAYDRRHTFAPSERALFTSLAGLVAQALDRAHLYDDNHRLAHGLQAGLLPHALPRMAGLEVAARYLPSGRGTGVGGDLYDLIRLDDTNAAAAIGDVQGHSVQAATLMGQVRTAVHATAGAPPGEVLARANRLLTDLEPGLFTSCLYVHLDLARHQARLACAGHPPPVLRHPDGRAEVVDVPANLLLGIDADAEYECAAVTLPPGSVLVLYTDGLVEVPGVDLGDAVHALADRLALAGDLDAEALADVLVHDVRHRAHRCDDVALLVLRAR